MRKAGLGLAMLVSLGLAAGCAVEKKQEVYQPLTIVYHGDGVVDVIVRKSNVNTSLYNRHTGESANFRGDAVLRLRSGTWEIYQENVSRGTIVAGRVIKVGTR